MISASNFSNYRTITARFDSTGACGHDIKTGDTIGWNRRTKECQCKECWSKWQAENAAADFDEAQYSSQY